MKIKKASFGFLSLVVLGLALRLVLMPISLHPDLWAISFSEYLFAFKGVGNIYDYLGSLPADSALARNYGSNFFTYPPLAYYTLGIFGLILRPLYSADFFAGLAENLPNILSDSRLFGHLFLTKLPYLFFDFGVLFLLVKLFDDPRKKFLSAVLWLFNPLSLYTTYMIGQFDIIPVFFMVLSLYLSKKNFPLWAAFYLGIGGAYKMFPLLLLPFLAFSQGRKFKRSLLILIVGILPYLLSILPFIASGIFRQTVLLSSQSQKMFFAKISVSGAEYLSVFLVVYVLLLALACNVKRSPWKWFLAVMLCFFGVTHYHPQWFLWIAPLLTLFVIEFPGQFFHFTTLHLCWLAITLMFEPSLSISLFAPIQSSLASAASLSDLLTQYFDPFLFKSIVRSVFAGVAVFVGFFSLRSAEVTEEIPAAKTAVRKFTSKKVHHAPA